MILIDLSQIMWAGIYAQGNSYTKIDDDLIRHIILNSIRSTRKKFASKYGEIVICCDGKNYWRKKINPYYKANRKKARESSKIDMEVVFSSMDKIKEELKTVFPYKIIEVEGAEADDVIGTLCQRYASRETVAIISSDHDFAQLKKYGNVVHISPKTKKEIVETMSPDLFLKQHIIIGDSGDGIANLLSDIDTLVTEGKRQKPISKKKLAEWVNMTPEEFCAETGVSIDRYRLNEKLVDLSKTPDELKQQIIAVYESEKKTPIGGWGNRILNYFIKNRMKVMTDYLDDFTFRVKSPRPDNPVSLENFFA